MKILIVDGERNHRQHLVHVLGAVTNVVIQGAVPDMQSALSAVVEASPDVVVTGTALPDGDGAQLIRNVRRLARTPSFVVVTDTAEDGERERYLAAGVDRIVETRDNPHALQLAISTLRPRAGGSIPPEETERLLGRLSAGVVHDLNNYLHVIDVTLTLLRRHPQDPELWQQSEAALGAMSRLHATLLAYARGGTQPLGLVDLGELARETVAVLGRIVPPEIAVHLDLAERLPPVQGVRAELEQLVLNLIVNACDAMKRGGDLTISVRKSAAAAVVLEVRDSGTGEVPPTLDGRTVSRKRRGAGLGLGIVQAVVQRHRGAFTIGSGPDGGTKVVVMLPTAARLVQ
jgi:signal transduction histidine kinase